MRARAQARVRDAGAEPGVVDDRAGDARLAAPAREPRVRRAHRALRQCERGPCGRVGGGSACLNGRYTSKRTCACARACACVLILRLLRAQNFAIVRGTRQ